MKKNVVFRGCTRPAMLLGVPYVPFFIGAGGTLVFSMYTNMLYMFFIPVIILILRQMARRDEMIFRLLGLRWQFKFRARNIGFNSGKWVFTPNSYRKSPPPR